ncbi:syndetin-like [Oncorhynchus nerka]|uniref:syndetin-like n=1 Tax=Oncorhynchus nerka TaxID=8023 RepID=UPI0031B82F32
MQWHEERDKEDSQFIGLMKKMGDDEWDHDETGATDTADTVVDHSYVKKKLEHGLTRIWQEVQLEVKAYLLGTDMSNFKYDDFIVVLDVISRLMQVGEEFCVSKLLNVKVSTTSRTITGYSMREIAKKLKIWYNAVYYSQNITEQTVSNQKRKRSGKLWTRLEELRLFLEGETWDWCPVKSNFNITQLHEFKFMGQCRSPSVSPSRQVLSSQDQEVLSNFELFSQEGNPFERHIDNKDEETEDMLASNGCESDKLEKSVYQDYDSDSDVPDELKQDEQTGDIPLKSLSRETLRSRKKSDYSLNKGSNAPILTNTTLNVIRLVG